MTSYLVAIDNGSQSTKVHVIDERGAVHASARVGLRPYAHPAPGHAVHPGDDLWESIVAATRSALERFSGDRGAIVGVGLCTIRFCRALLTETGELAEPVLSWMDERVGRPHTPDPRVAHVTTSSGYITHRLTGRYTDTAANYQGLWPIDRDTWRWSDDPAAAERTGMPRTLLSDLVDPGDELGRVTERAAELTGLPAGLPVFATANDKAVEALGAGLTAPDQVLLSLGTYISAMTTAASSADGAAYWTNFASTPHRYLAESAGIRRGMWTISWLRDLLHADNPRDESMYDWEARLDAVASDIPPGSDGVRAVLDWLAPADEPTRRGAILGFSGPQGPAHLYRAILEGIAFEMADNIDAMADELGRTFGEVVVTGGGARSATIRAVLADSLGLPVRQAAFDDAAGLGAAICAAVGAGVHPTWDAAVAAMVRRAEPQQPRTDAAATYARLRLQHRRTRAAVRALEAELTDRPGTSALYVDASSRQK